MAAVDHWSLRTRVPAMGTTAGATEQVRASFKREAWAWFEAHKDEVVISVRVWIIKREVTLSDLRPLWERVFGPAEQA